MDSKLNPVEIINPFTSLDGYNCFGCSPNNPLGLHMHFHTEGEYVLCDWQPEPNLQGWFNILHGGIQATLMDEISGWLVLVKLNTAGVTSKMEVSYLKPVRIDQGTIRLRARLKEMIKKIALIEVQLFTNEGELCAEALIHYYTYPEHIARERMYYPGIESFFPTPSIDQA